VYKRIGIRKKYRRGTKEEEERGRIREEK